MRKRFPFLFIFVLLLSACTAVPQGVPAAPTEDRAATLSAIVSATMSAISTEAPTATGIPDPSTTPTVVITEQSSSTGQNLTRTDEQGAVMVDVTPGNLSNPVDSIEFEVGMNTHSVDLSMDLAALATLKTDTGRSVAPLSWEGMAGGHHVSGKLIFPSQVDGKPLLEGASTLTLVIQNVDVPERTFTWEIGS
ncbi:MAG TPA: hypothetical protein VHP14_18645 [Anaerolineales bacterium]|nr:hypothetical protein [Anaerolineales bacterium]